MIANHGQRIKYHHDVIGVNSRLDTLQASILKVKLKYLDDYAARRQAVAAVYDQNLSKLPFLETPVRVSCSTHVYHQYTLKIVDGKRDAFKEHLEKEWYPHDDLLSGTASPPAGVSSRRIW